MEQSRFLVVLLVFFGALASAQKAGPTIPPDSGHGIYLSGFEMLSRVQDPDALKAYPFQVLEMIRDKWYPQASDLQKSMGTKAAVTSVDFEIRNDGSVSGVETVESTKDSSMDGAATLAILQAAPFPQTPEGYRQKTLKMRMHFGYDQPGSADAPFCDGPDSGAHHAVYALHYVKNGVTPPKAQYAPNPEYSEDARKAKYQSAVTLAGTVDPQGAFTDICVMRAAGHGLDEKAMEAVKTWRFEPASLDGEPVAVRVHVDVSFRLY
jgi:TonB family protein